MRFEANTDLSQVIYVDESNPLPSSFMSLHKCGRHHSPRHLQYMMLNFISLPSIQDNFSCYLSLQFLAVEYSRTINHHCRQNGYEIVFSTLDAAKAKCSMDDNCVGVYDNCGRGNEFALCAAPLNIGYSSCGSILHQYKFNYQKFEGKGISILMAKDTSVVRY